ncbi:hypothetical protein [Arthrobacter sp. PAMC25564]|uniref:hypothetical protein n=1 Tax=Arthrobacter sp. PAMC25564 TaxID=2565366 RepID=UPI001F0E2E62|nr:hypothetical protein [Arthrobacter sp. PAMC25564]
MSEKIFKDRVLDQSAKDKKDIGDWMYRSGGKVLGAILMAWAVILRGIWRVFGGVIWRSQVPMSRV